MDYMDNLDRARDALIRGDKDALKYLKTSVENLPESSETKLLYSMLERAEELHRKRTEEIDRLSGK